MTTSASAKFKRPAVGENIRFLVNNQDWKLFNGMRSGTVRGVFLSDGELWVHCEKGFEWSVKQLGETIFEARRGPIQ